MKKLIVFMIFLLSLFLFIGCSSKVDPIKLAEDYYKDIKDGNYENSYNKISAESQERFCKEDYLLYMSLKAEAYEFTEVNVEKLSEEKDKEIISGKTKYKNIAKLKVNEKTLDKYSDKEQTDEYELFTVEENGEWKIHRGLEDGKQLLAKAYNTVGKMYYEGKGKEKDLNKATEMFIKGIECDGNYYDNYYYLAQTYYYLGNYNEAMKQCDNYISKPTNNSEKSNTYNIKGLCYAKSGQDKKAKQMYEKAVGLDPNNTAAKLNLDYYSTVNPLIPYY